MTVLYQPKTRVLVYLRCQVTLLGVNIYVLILFTAYLVAVMQMEERIFPLNLSCKEARNAQRDYIYIYIYIH